ncbi:MAG: DUF6455 family protein [Woeseiaceae bacterium]|nr:DUF6455 family protein [Woeseiaceae bacterium]
MVEFPTSIFVGLLMLAIAIAIAVGYSQYLAAGSERRMRFMLEAAGLDPDIVERQDLATTMAEVRDRCRHCQSEAVCERWLAGEEGGENDFCPNQQVFEILARMSRAPD